MVISQSQPTIDVYGLLFWYGTFIFTLTAVCNVKSILKEQKLHPTGGAVQEVYSLSTYEEKCGFPSEYINVDLAIRHISYSRYI